MRARERASLKAGSVVRPSRIRWIPPAVRCPFPVVPLSSRASLASRTSSAYLLTVMYPSLLLNETLANRWSGKSPSASPSLGITTAG